MENDLILLSHISVQLSCPVPGAVSSKGVRHIGVMRWVQIPLLKLAEFSAVAQGCYLGASFKGWLSNLAAKLHFDFNNSQRRAKALRLKQCTPLMEGESMALSGLETTSNVCF